MDLAADFPCDERVGACTEALACDRLGCTKEL